MLAHCSISFHWLRMAQTQASSIKRWWRFVKQSRLTVWLLAKDELISRQASHNAMAQTGHCFCSVRHHSIIQSGLYKLARIAMTLHLPFAPPRLELLRPRVSLRGELCSGATFLFNKVFRRQKQRTIKHLLFCLSKAP